MAWGLADWLARHDRDDVAVLPSVLPHTDEMGPISDADLTGWRVSCDLRYIVRGCEQGLPGRHCGAPGS